MTRQSWLSQYLLVLFLRGKPRNARLACHQCYTPVHDCSKKPGFLKTNSLFVVAVTKGQKTRPLPKD